MAEVIQTIKGWLQKILEDDPERGLEEGDDFFLPDLCNTQAVITLVISGELIAIIMVLVSHPLPNFSLENLALASLLIQWVTLTCAAILCRIRNFLRTLSQKLAIAVAFVIILFDTAIFSAMGDWALSPTWNGVMFVRDIDYWMLAQNVLISTIVSAMLFRYFLVQHRLREKESAELNARLQSLQSRIRPHFLFNSMNIIASLIAIDPKTAESVIEDLADLFRASLKETANAVPLEKELALCKKYLRIEQLRLDKRLQIEWIERKVPDNVEIPMLLLQPILENAVYHGIQPRPEGGTIKIILDYIDGQFEILVTNPLSEQVHVSTKKGNQMAIKNIRTRLSAIYGPKGTLECKEINGEFHSTISFPHSV